MKLLALTCVRCGAPCDVPVGTRRAICEYCDCRLVVVTSEHNTPYTQPAPADEMGASMTVPVAAPTTPSREVREQLRRLDLYWRRRRREFMTRNGDGTWSVPRRGTGKAVMVEAFMIAAMSILFSNLFWEPLIFPGLGLTAILGWLGWRWHVQARYYYSAQDDYRSTRRRIAELTEAEAETATT